MVNFPRFFGYGAITSSMSPALTVIDKGEGKNVATIKVRSMGSMMLSEAQLTRQEAEGVVHALQELLGRNPGPAPQTQNPAGFGPPA